MVRPAPQAGRGRAARWPGNLGILAVDIVVVRLLVPTAAVGFALVAEQEGWGLFRALCVPFWAAVVAGVIALDLVMYLQRVVFHYVPVLWRLHRMHHADLDIDVTTGLRFHPIEILLSLGIKGAWWDHLFGTYRKAPRAGEEGIVIGLPIFCDLKELRLTRLLTQPFRNDKSAPRPGESRQ